MLTTNPLQALVTKTPNGVQGTPNYVDLGTKTFTIGGDPTVQFPFFVADMKKDLVLTGSGAKVVVLEAPETLHRCGVLNRGTRIRFEGDVTVIGPRPDGARWNVAREAESGIVSEGSIDCFMGWTVTNMWGSSYSVRRRRTSGQPDRRTKNITVAFTSNQAGRQHINVDDADGIDVSFQGTDCVRSALDVEIPGHQGVVNDLHYHDTDLYSHWNGMAFANLGQGKTVGGCRDFLIERVRCHGKPFAMHCFAPDGTRRGPYAVRDCWSDTRSNITPLRYEHIDNVTVQRITQSLTSGVKLAQFLDCTGVTCDVPYETT